MTRPPRERAARALCRIAGNPEDAKFEGRPMWESYLPEVDVVLESAGIVLALDTAERMALHRFANDAGADLPDAAKTALRDWLIGHGWLEPTEADNHGEGDA